ncbi:MAG: hypothetical protein FLDDKLPJ_00736 [Phycisphaerae bacterium]|nr:hypothetical protein [Phycisphaerae bacterium]
MNAENRDPQTHAIIGGAIEVHRQLGSGFLEAVYQEAMACELDARGVSFKAQAELPVFYKGTRLRCTYKADFVCYDAVIVELKALSALTSIEQSQVLNYLKASGIERALLINFGKQKLEFQRLVRSTPLRHSASSADEISTMPAEAGAEDH